MDPFTPLYTSGTEMKRGRKKEQEFQKENDRDPDRNDVRGRYINFTVYTYIRGGKFRQHTHTHKENRKRF